MPCCRLHVSVRAYNSLVYLASETRRTHTRVFNTVLCSSSFIRHRASVLAMRRRRVALAARRALRRFASPLLPICSSFPCVNSCAVRVPRHCPPRRPCLVLSRCGAVRCICASASMDASGLACVACRRDRQALVPTRVNNNAQVGRGAAAHQSSARPRGHCCCAETEHEARRTKRWLLSLT